ncbi:PP2C family protein-serine/threonine phosphatase [Streptomyces specialis]|uniref:PP2C family protein-serine/threonine phosphatase n=1 Tax=Streptomyces specialis TaxID=498367 RepID=UPI00073F22F0|nr:PP2C family protein-serine/threonine phosphatase [Streptomyces specialis]
MTDEAQMGRMLAAMMQIGHTATLEELPELIASQAAAAGAHDATVYVVDLQDTVLRELTGRGLDAGEGGERFPVDGTLPGRAYQRVELYPDPGATGGEGSRQRWWLPVTDGVERLGVLRADLDATAGDGPGTRALLRALASMTALLLLSKRSFSDSYARLVRTRPMNVAAELQWNLMPPPAYAGHSVTVGAALEPAYTVGGDAYDYAVTGTTLHLGIFDAMGHDTAAGLTANVAVAACRNARRQGASLARTSEVIEETLVDHFGTSRYTTAIIADLDLATGRLTWVNRGHHLPIVVRGGRWVSHLTCPPGGPLGAGLGLPVTECHDQLEPGDRLLLYTDGIPEARDARGRPFGMDQFTDFIVRHHSARLTLHETLRRLMHAVLRHHSGRLDDDATVLLTEWRGGHQSDLTP